jgi:hypothetical protein
MVVLCVVLKLSALMCTAFFGSAARKSGTVAKRIKLTLPVELGSGPVGCLGQMLQSYRKLFRHSYRNQ